MHLRTRYVSHATCPVCRTAVYHSVSFDAVKSVIENRLRRRLSGVAHFPQSGRCVPNNDRLVAGKSHTRCNSPIQARIPIL